MVHTKAEKHLVTTDPVMDQVISAFGPLDPHETQPYFTALAKSIISQQISVIAAAKIFERFRHETDLTPEHAAALDEAAIKRIGLSGQKAQYIHDLAEHFVRNPAVYDHLDKLDDTAVIAELVGVKGIGVWTAQMFLIFTLRRPDVFAPDDRGLQLAIEKLYGLTGTRAELEQFATRWVPYRSTASRYLWRSLDTAPILER